MGACVPRGPVREIAPAELADRVRPLLDRALLAFDVDGVLAPIVEHADQAVLSPGVDDLLRRLAERTEVVILSGRSLASLESRFGFPETLHVIGSHGLEARGEEPLRLDPSEAECYRQLEELALAAVRAAGAGAWLEHKPTSLVVHTRSADSTIAEPARQALVRQAAEIEGARVKAGHEVIELLARPSSKGEALLKVAGERGRAPIVFLGDDLTDEEAFAMMGDADIAVRVGPGETVADVRLAGPEQVVELLRLL
jgi:trehalose-phosphatase